MYKNINNDNVYPVIDDIYMRVLKVLLVFCAKIVSIESQSLYCMVQTMDIKKI